MPASVLYVIDNATAKPRPLRLATASGVLSVDGSGATQPVSGTFYQATQPVSAASLPLPSGAATATLQGTSNTALTAIKTAVEGTLTTTAAVSKDFATLSNGVTATAGDFSSSHDISNYRHLNIAGTSSATDNIELFVSNDNSTFYKLGDKQTYPMADGSFAITLDSAPFKYYKLKYVASGTYTAVGFASN